MTNFTNQYPANTYADILTTTNNGQGLSPSTLQPLQDALGNNSPITICQNAVNFNRSAGNTFQLDGIPLTASASALNNITGQSSPYASGFYVTSGLINTNGLLNINSNPINLITAFGVGTGILLHRMVLNYVYGGTAFGGGGNLEFFYTGGNIAFDMTGQNINLAGVTQSTIYNTYGISYSLPSAQVNDENVFLTAAANYTTGNGSLYYSIWYSVLEVF